MKYKVTKKFFDPFLKARVIPGEYVEVATENIEGYKQYIEIPVIEKAVVKEVVETKVKKK